MSSYFILGQIYVMHGFDKRRVPCVPRLLLEQRSRPEIGNNQMFVNQLAGILPWRYIREPHHLHCRRKLGKIRDEQTSPNFTQELARRSDIVRARAALRPLTQDRHEY